MLLKIANETHSKIAYRRKNLATMNVIELGIVGASNFVVFHKLVKTTLYIYMYDKCTLIELLSILTSTRSLLLEDTLMLEMF